MSTHTINGRPYDTDSDLVGATGNGLWGMYRSTPGTRVWDLLLDDLAADLAAATSIQGVSPGASGGLAVSNGSAWVRSSDLATYQDAVHAPTLGSSWVDYGGAFAGAGYWKDYHGVVHLRGLIKSGTTTDGTVLFTLPSGYRPSAWMIFPTVSNNAAAAIVVQNTGDVAIQANASATWLSLSGITFRAA